MSGKARDAKNRERSQTYVSDFWGPRNAASRVLGQPQQVRGIFHKLSIESIIPRDHCGGTNFAQSMP